MINITDKHACCGCEACVQRCPKQCIHLLADEEGFFYPHVDMTACVDCKLCEDTCSVINQNKVREPLWTFAARNSNEEVRKESSSGGIFSLLAEDTIAQGGVVFGARFNEHWEVVHDYTETIEGIRYFRGSKYVQSHVGKNYKLVLQFLKQGREVLFSGTPCQIAALRRYVHNDYSNLLTVETFCHSVPSPGQWKMYLNETCELIGQRINDISIISFRDKCTGWKSYSFAMHFLDGSVFKEKNGDNSWMRAFVSGLLSRPSCSRCPVKKLRSGADICLGDFWGIQHVLPEYDDDKGTNLIVVCTNKGKEAISHIKVDKRPVQYAEVCKFNAALTQSVNLHTHYDDFFSDTKRTFRQKVKHYCKPSVTIILKVFVYKLLKFAKIV